MLTVEEDVVLQPPPKSKWNLPTKACSKLPSCINRSPKISASRKLVGSGVSSADIIIVVDVVWADRALEGVVVALVFGYWIVYA